MIKSIENKVLTNKRLSSSEALWLFENCPENKLKQLASFERDKQHAANKATYLVMSIINFTNVCVALCDYCSFYVLPRDKKGYLLSFDEICRRVDELIHFGGSIVSFNSGFNPKLNISFYQKLFSKIHEKYPQLTFFEMTIAEFMFACQISKMTYNEGAKALKACGTQWITGGGAEILEEKFRQQHSPRKYTVKEYFSAQKAILDSGINSTATMVIGFGESIEQRVQHLETLRHFQDSNERKLPSFLCWTYKPYGNLLGGQEIGNNEYCRWLAVCRLYLDNFKHIRTSVLTKNEEALYGLSYGANDFDLPTEDEVTEKAGATISHDFEAILSSCKEIGFEPVRREPF
ncbi:MAG: radical SAM protein [Zetaproteobacteria bacterium]|nr:radical SAM protein [Pseudobdellovibrionaceae bacterium]